MLIEQSASSVASYMRLSNVVGEFTKMRNSETSQLVTTSQVVMNNSIKLGAQVVYDANARTYQSYGIIGSLVDFPA